MTVFFILCACRKQILLFYFQASNLIFDFLQKVCQNVLIFSLDYKFMKTFDREKTYK